MRSDAVVQSLAILKPKQKTCEACGAQFECASMAGRCWCSEVKVSADTLKELKSRYADCLCPNCLHEAAKKIPAPITPRS